VPPSLRQQGERPGHQLAALQHHQVGEHEHRDDPGDGVGDGLRHACRPGTDLAELRLQRVLVLGDVLVHVEAAQQVADRAAPVLRVVDVARQPVSDVGALGDERGHQQGDDGGQQDEAEKEHEQRGQRAPQAQSTLSEPHDGRQHDREERGDHAPDEYALEPHHQQHRERCQQQQADGRDDGPDRDPLPHGRWSRGRCDGLRS